MVDFNVTWAQVITFALINSLVNTVGTYWGNKHLVEAIKTQENRINKIRKKIKKHIVKKMRR